jgi:hypothetical protein
MDRNRFSDFLIVGTFFSAALLSAYGAAPRPGPKLVQADGVTYTACGGALWIADMKEPNDNEPPTYEVIFKDAHGTKHQLAKVRTLRITDLPDNTPACSNPK